MSFRNSRIITSTQNDSSSSQNQPEKLARFKEVLTDSGVILSQNEEPHIITQEQALVVRDIKKNLNERHVPEFMNGLKFLCRKERNFRNALIKTQFRKAGNPNVSVSGQEIKIQQESLIRLLLQVPCLQKEVIELVLEELTTMSLEETENPSYFRLLLNNLNYLPNIQDPTILTTKLLDILEISTFASQLEILDSIPQILPDNQYEQVSKVLCKLLDSNNDLSAALIDCLGALNLLSETRTDIQDRIIAKMLSGTCVKIFPILLEFLLSDNNNNKSQNISSNLMKIRSALDNLMGSSSSNDKDSTKVLVFRKLEKYARAAKIISETWLSLLTNIKNHSDHKAVDFLILFMLHLKANLKKRTIEAVFRKRVKDGLFKASLLEKMFENCITSQLLKDYFKSIVEIGCSLLRTSQEVAVIDFASTLFTTLFNHSFTEVIYRQQLLDNLIPLIGKSSQTNASCPVLNVLINLLDNISRVQRHTIQLMRLLDKIDCLDLRDVKAVFEILCSLTCGENADDSLSGFKDELHMIVRKQLSSWRRSIKHRGIISAVVMAKHIVTITEEQSEISVSEDSLINIEHLPQDGSREAAILLDMTNLNTSSCPELIGLYYDQVASMLMTPKNLNKHFMSWLYESITNDFQNIFVTDTVLEAINDLKFSMQYSLNTEDEMDSPIAINIAELTIKPKQENRHNILVLAPHFRLLRLLHYKQQNGDLSSIDALLGCAIVLPNTTDLEIYDSEQLKQIADCLFHCINWFREIISGFVTQKSKKLRYKVLQRLQDLIQVENLLNKCLETIPEHKLPVSYFDSLSQISKQHSPMKTEKKVNRPKKKFKSSETVNNDTTLPSTSTAVAENKGAKNKKSTSNTVVQEYEVNFRQIDTDLLILLKYPLKISDETEQSTTQNPQGFLDINQLIFILKDFIYKLNVLTKHQNIGLSHLNIVNPIDIITDCIKILPHLNKHLLIIKEKLVEILMETDERHDSPELYTKVATNLKYCFGLILECFSLVFSWSGFQHSKNIDLLRQILQSLRSESSQTLHSVNHLIKNFIDRLVSLIDQCLHLNHAVSLVGAMKSLYAVLPIPNPDIKKKIIAVCANLLNKRWYNKTGTLDSGKNCLQNIDFLVKVYLEGANIKTLCGLVGKLQEEVPNLKTKDDHLNMLASIDKSSFHIFFRGFSNALHKQVKIEIESLTNEEHLVLWKRTALTMAGLMTVVKSQETKSNMSCYLKTSTAILKIFLSHGIPILEIVLRSKPDEVVEIFKTIQISTRFLHHLSCQSKLSKDMGLVAYVPQFRLTLEAIIYRVKAALVANNCSAAFWMGNLRNRDLQGEDILSQSTVVTESTESGNNEEELPEDDSDSDISVLNESNNNSENKSESEIFD